MGVHKVIGEDESVAVAVIERIAQAMRATAYVAGRLPGSGVLVGTEALLTNNHVLVGFANDRPANVEDARDVVARFNFQDAANGTPLAPVDVPLRPEQILHASAQLDYALVGVDPSVHDTWGCFSLAAHSDVGEGDDIFIVGHPDGRPKRISLADNEVLQRADPWLRYTADTAAGSSGSPVFDRNFDLVAVHHLAHHNSTLGHYNEGVLVQSIVADLPETLSATVARLA